MTRPHKIWWKREKSIQKGWTGLAWTIQSGGGVFESGGNYYTRKSSETVRTLQLKGARLKTEERPRKRLRYLLRQTETGVSRRTRNIWAFLPSTATKCDECENLLQLLEAVTHLEFTVPNLNDTHTHTCIILQNRHMHKHVAARQSTQAYASVRNLQNKNALHTPSFSWQAPF